MTDNNNQNLPNDPYAEFPEDHYADTSKNESDAPTKKRLITPFGVVVMLATLLMVAVVIWGIYQNQQDTLKDGEAPDFTLRTYTGQTLQLSEFEGEQVVVLNFWQTNCAPCHEEADMLVKVYEEYAEQGVVFIGINSKDPDDLALQFIAEYDVSYPNGLDTGDEIQDMYRTTGYPETFVIDRNGDIQYHFAGAVPELNLRQEIEAALENS